MLSLVYIYTELSEVGGQHTQALCTIPGQGRPRIFQMESEMKQEIPKLSVSLYNILEVCSECFLEIETRDKTNGLSLCL